MRFSDCTFLDCTFSGCFLSDIEVGLQSGAAAFAPETRLLVAAERRGGVEAVERVGPDDAGPQLVGHPKDARALLGPDPGGQPVRRVVRLGDGLVRRAEG